MRIKDSVFRNMTPCNMVEECLQFGETCYFIFKTKDGEIIFLDMSANLASYTEYHPGAPYR